MSGQTRAEGPEAKRLKCSRCGGRDISKGRAADGRRAYRCGSCGEIWTSGTMRRKEGQPTQNHGFQFATQEGGRK